MTLPMSIPNSSFNMPFFFVPYLPNEKIFKYEFKNISTIETTLEKLAWKEAQAAAWRPVTPVNVDILELGSQYSSWLAAAIAARLGEVGGHARVVDVLDGDLALDDALLGVGNGRALHRPLHYARPAASADIEIAQAQFVPHLLGVLVFLHTD